MTQTRPTSTPPFKAEAVKLFPESSGDADPWGQANLRFPLIRCRALRRGKREFVAITPSCLTVGTIKGRITEERLAARARDTSFAVEEIPIESIRKVYRQRVGYLSESSLWTRYTIESSRPQTHQFRVCDRDAENVERALQLLLSDRLDPIVRRRLSGIEWTLIAAVVVAAACLGLSILHLGFLRASVVIGLAVGLVLLAVVLRKQTSPFASRPRQGRRKRKAGGEPVRSPVLGWALKLAGVGWIALILFSGTFDPLYVYLLQKFHSAAPYLFALLYAPGFALLHWGSRLCLRIFSPSRHPDARPPVLYLRGFGDDGKGTYQPTGFLGRLHALEEPWRQLPFWFVHPVNLLRKFCNASRYSAEELLASAFRRWGPFIAIGQPGERLATPGADRMYVTDADWQRVVLDYLRQCQAVVLQPSSSEGIRWEVEQVFARMERHRILLSMTHFRNRPNDYEDFCARLQGITDVCWPVSVPFVDEPCFVYFERDGTPRIQRVCRSSPLLWSFTGNGVDTKRTFHSFIQGLQGGPRELPSDPKKHRGHGLLSTVFPGTFILILIFGPSLPHYAQIATKAVLEEPAPPPVARNEAMHHLSRAEAHLESAPARHRTAWEASQSAGLISSAGAWAGNSPVHALVDAHLRLVLLGSRDAQPERPLATLPPLDQMRRLLQEAYVRQRDDTPPALLYLAIRAARRAVAVNPEDAQAYLVLGRSYLLLLDKTRERAWGQRLPELLQLRYAQASAALNLAVSLNPDLAQAHFHLAVLYWRLGHLDLALKHGQAFLEKARVEGIPVGVSPEHFFAQEEMMQKDMKKLADIVEERKDRLASADRKVLERARLAAQLGLAAAALETLQGSDAALGAEETGLLLNLLVQTGRANDALNRMASDHREGSGAGSLWLKAQALAALGEYARADEECTRIIQSLGPGERGGGRIREAVAVLVGREVLDEGSQIGAESFQFQRRLGRVMFTSRAYNLVMMLRQEADLTVVRGVLALEQAKMGQAASSFRKALGVWEDEASAASGAGLEFGGRAMAQGYLALLEDTLGQVN